MSEQTAATTTSQRLQRRGLMAGVAALVGAGIGKVLGAGRAEAGHDGSLGYIPGTVMHLGLINDGGNAANDESATNILTETVLVASLAPGNTALRVRNLNNGTALRAVAGGSQAGDGGTGVHAFGGTSGSRDGGAAVNCLGGVSESGRGGTGAVCQGGNSSAGNGGNGIFTQGGNSPGAGNGGIGVFAIGGDGATPGDGVLGAGRGAVGAGSNGVRGETNSASNAGVRGQNTGSGPGVLGQSGSTGTGNGTGVQGQSGGGIGVFGQSTSNAGVYGFSSANIGVRGESQQSVGVFGSSANNFAFYGLSTGGVGFYGKSTGNIGVYAEATTGTALFAFSQSGPAAQFFGPVFVTGNHTVTGAKSAAVPHPDGSHRRLYAMECPESYFEDFGRANLVNGRADVRLDRDFAAVVRADDYDVFLTPYGDTSGLYVSSRSPAGFEVREVRNGTGALAFSYRVVAKRRDIPGPRLEKVDLPPRLTLPPVPPPPPVPPRLEPVEPPGRPAEPPGRGPQR
jgi:hypothetical protein